MSRIMQLAACAALVTIGSNEAAFAQAACDRDCLRSTLDRYLEAVVAHDPSKAPLVVGFRQTENAINVAPGKGVWRSVTALGNVQRRYFDAITSHDGIRLTPYDPDFAKAIESNRDYMKRHRNALHELAKR